MSVLRLRPGGLFWRESGDDVVVLDTTTSKYVAADGSAALLWKRLAAGATREQLVSALCDHYGVAGEVAERDVSAFVEQLSERGLLEA